MRRARLFLPLLLAALLLCACAASGGDTADVRDGGTAPAAEAGSGTVIELSDGTAAIRGGGASASGGAVTISAAGTYTVRGVLDGGTLIVDTGDDAVNVTILLDGASISSPDGPALWIRQAKNVYLETAEGTENTLRSGTEADLASFDDTRSGAALYSEDDLILSGGGTLRIEGFLNNGLTCKDDLEIRGGTVEVRSANNGLRASESITVSGGSLAVEAGNDGLKTTSVKKAGKGWIELSGGSVSITAGDDGIQSVTDLRLSGGSAVICAAKQALRAEGEILLTGGSLLSLCGSDKQAEPAPDSMAFVLAALAGQAGDLVEIDGVGAVTAATAFRFLLCADETLPSGETLTVRVGGAEQTVTVR